MKKTSKSVGVKEDKIDYFKLRENTPLHLRKRMTMKEFHETIIKVREQKLKKAS